MPQTYEEYLDEMKAYNFSPLDYDTWASWQVFYHGANARLRKPVGEGSGSETDTQT